MIQDFKFAFRQLLKSPGFTSIAVLTLALAIGVNSAIFALINGAALRSPVPLRPAEVVNVFTAKQSANRDYRQFSYDEYRAVREGGSDVFADVASLEFSLAGIGEEQNMRRSFVFLTSENFFSLMGIKPIVGRFYNAEECRPNSNTPVVVASYGFWQRMGGRKDFVGSNIRLNGQPYTVIGVTPEGFSGTNVLVSPELWVPLGLYSQVGSAFSDQVTLNDLAQPKNYALNVVARLKPGLTVESAKPRLSVIAQRLTSIQPPDAAGARELQVQTPSRFSLSTQPEDDGPVALVALLLAGMAGAVLLIASLNLANMLLARGAARAKEIALRLALGATRWRIVRQLLCEGLLLALIGGAAGMVVSSWSNDLLMRSFASLLGGMNLSIVLHVHPDLTVLAVTFLFCLIATLLFSLGPALKATRLDLVSDLKQQTGEPAHVGRFNRFFAPRHILVMAQIALSLMLLFSAGLFLHGALQAGGLNPGFEPRGGLVAEMDFSLGKKDPIAARRLMFAAVQRARQLPGVRAAALSTMVPYGNFTNTRRIMPANEAPAAKTDTNAPDPGASGLFTAITPGYFEAIGVRLLRGRDFTATEAENKDSLRVAILDEEMANKLFPKGDALGQRVRYTQPPADGSSSEMEVVGIVSKHRHDVQNDTLMRRLFVPLAQRYSANTYLHVRFSSTDRRVVAANVAPLRQALRSVDPDLPILRIIPFSDLLEKSVGLWIVRLGAVLFGVFGGIALLLAVVGVYGVKAYAVARRTREIGIRMALGAHRGDVFALIMKQGALQTGFAVAVGLLLSLGAGRVLSQILYNVSPTDPGSLAIATIMLAAAALLACFLPARRATRVNPMTALRTE
jgi:putative ABC transport system permease protein